MFSVRVCLKNDAETGKNRNVQKHTNEKKTVNLKNTDFARTYCSGSKQQKNN